MSAWWTERPRPPSLRERLGIGAAEPVGAGAPRFLPLAPPRLGEAANATPEWPRLGGPRRLRTPVAQGEAASLRPVASRLAAAGTVDLSLETDAAFGPAAYGLRGGAASWGMVPAPPPAPSTATEPLGPSLAERLLTRLQPPLASYLGRQAVIEWPRDFFPYQREGIRALVEHEALLLADDMGLGKTVQTIAALRILLHLRRIEAALLVVPAGLVIQWQRALREWAPELRTSTVKGQPHERSWQWQAPAHLYLTSYETLRSDFSDNPRSPPRRRVWDVVVLDEAQKIKNRDSEVSRVCKRLPRRRAWALTGTPLENDLEELASLCEFLAQWQEGDRPLRLAPGPELAARHAELQLRRKKSEVLPQLPPKSVVEIPLQLAPSQRHSYERAEREGVVWLRELGGLASITHVLELVTRLKQLCNFCPATGESAKLADLEERLETLADEGHKALIFSQYTDERYGVRALARRLVRFQPLAYTGDLSAGERDAVITAFKQRPLSRALILSLRAGGQGLNLQEASYVFHFDRWWNPATERQAEDRAHRLGQASPVTVYKYICEGTIEERIHRVLRRKQALFEQLVDDVSIDLGRHLTQDELWGLFGLTPPGGSAPAPRAAPAFAELSGDEFERYLADLLRRLGWTVARTPRTRDGGVDLRATKLDATGVEAVLDIQCKHQQAPVGVAAVRELNGVLERGAQGVIASPSGFTADATRFAYERGIKLWNAGRLQNLAREAGVGGA
jgi:superfamily II DNA or RNA helicase